METLSQSIPLIADFLTSPQFWLGAWAGAGAGRASGDDSRGGSLTIASIIVPFAILEPRSCAGGPCSSRQSSRSATRMDSVRPSCWGTSLLLRRSPSLKGINSHKGEKGARALGVVYAVSTIGGVSGAIALALLLPIIRPFIILFSFPRDYDDGPVRHLHGFGAVARRIPARICRGRCSV